MSNLSLKSIYISHVVGKIYLNSSSYIKFFIQILNWSQLTLLTNCAQLVFEISFVVIQSWDITVFATSKYVISYFVIVSFRRKTQDQVPKFNSTNADKIVTFLSFQHNAEIVRRFNSLLWRVIRILETSH